MTVANKKEPFILLLGDVILFYFSLWLALLFRYNQIPSSELISTHFTPFTIIFLVSLAVFFSAGLYEKHTMVLKSKLPGRIFFAQFANVILAILFFYLIPYFSITPKTNLFIYLLVSSTLLIIWRFFGHNIFSYGKKQNGILIGSGKEMHELLKEVNENPRYNLKFISAIDLDKADGVDFQEEIIQRVYSENVGVIVVDINDPRVEPILPHLYNLLFSHVRFIDKHKVYEDIFDRVPLSLVKDNWFLENISSTSKLTYDILKRGMDVIISLFLGTLSLLIYPIVIALIKVYDGGDAFFWQERVGQNNTRIYVLKFKTMIGNRDEQSLENDADRVTQLGSILRKLRIDELPQLWNVFLGDLSLIGPRPELPDLVKVYEEKVPYYNVRHLVKPGLSGWAQLYHDNHPHHDIGEEETKVKLAYDLFYIKNRSFFLEIKIALKTVAVLLSQKGK